ncbi:DUF2339 domain-containing protein [Verrucomicrobiota bacterium sgz303538]
MNSGLRFEFDVIQQDQARVHRLVADLDRRIDVLDRRLAEPAATPDATTPAPAPTPPPLPKTERTGITTFHSDTHKPAPFPSSVPQAPPPPPSASKSTEPESAPEAQPGDSWELAFGTVWLARIGIVILITGLVFLGNYAWQHIVSQLGAGGKVTLLYLAGALLAGIGAWLERGKETMRNYARVLMAGGAATVYYTTYAAHYVERLRVIESPLLGGTLLLAMAAGFIAWADRRRSEGLALLAVLLAYYTSAINAIGSFTLFSSLLLTGTAVFFLVKHRWAALGWASIIGTYGSYAFWRWHHAVDWSAYAGRTETLPSLIALGFLLGYWALFSTAAFVGKENAIASARPVLFVSANNGAFFALAAHQIGTRHPDSFWLLALVFGGVLLGLSALARWKWEESPSLESAYLAQGLALVTLGLISKLTGSQLALVLTFESALLLTGAGGRRGWLYQIAAALTAAGATGIAAFEIDHSPHLALTLGGTVATVMIGNAWWLKQRRGQLMSATWSWRAAWFAGLGLALLGQIAWEQVPFAGRPAALACIAVLTTAAAPSLRLPELLLGQILLGWAVIMYGSGRGSLLSSAWTPPVLLAALLGLEQWWQRQRSFQLESASLAVMQLFCAIGGIVVGCCWLRDYFPDEGWMVATSAAAIVTLLYGAATRAWATALVGQVFTLIAAKAFLLNLWSVDASVLVAITPVVAVAVVGVVIEQIGRHYANALPEGLTVHTLARVYRFAATAGIALWALRYISNDWLLPFFAGLGAVLVLVGTVTRSYERVITGAFFHAVALLTLWARFDVSMTWPGLLSILAVPASFRIARHWAGAEPFVSEDMRQTFTAAATASAWLWVTRWTNSTNGTQGLTVAWSTLALLTFAAGLGLRERVYRLAGFGILALAISRVFLIDVWRLETLYRILSFLVLGAVLLLLGFVYSRYAERIRRWM